MIIVGYFLRQCYVFFVAFEEEEEGGEEEYNYNAAAKVTNRLGQGAEEDIDESTEVDHWETSWFSKLLLPPPSPPASSTSCAHCIDIVSLTIRSDFFVLFNSSALTSWIEHIRNVRSITFIGPANDYELFRQYLIDHYPQLVHTPLSSDDADSNNYDGIVGIGGSNSSRSVTSIPIRYVNETHWISTYKERYRCPYPKACQQLIKLHVFDLHSHLDQSYLGDNVLMVDSDTVWSADSTFVDIDGRVQYFEAYDKKNEKGKICNGMDPILFTEGITTGRTFSGSGSPKHATLTPYKACVRTKYPNATGARHIVHHMLFQRDVMMSLHDVIVRRWDVSTLWEASCICHKLDHCRSRVSEYELYYAFISERYPERVRLETLIEGQNYVGSSSMCDAREMKCCYERGVLLKGCHDHRVGKNNLGLCCPN